MTDCIFCKIINNELPCDKIYEDEDFIAFHDLYPKADTHVLVIPKKHIESLKYTQDEDEALLGKITLLLPKLAEMLNLTDGFRTIINTGKGGGQEVFHLHYHILGGRQLPGL
ncbi:histidine triad nucleotide-binding protein [Thiotrichales bacterium 19S9-12]|nr:histidine triad nucleotide-binding protein [Thiotrichales bacterium 19S9-11]MCF6812160.1 histidine triad nucleotide-binding protein [Thiotrichales bacterium 19S9-12]